uniref:Rx N-terminal domain-containing protein n=1 Tax=Aegilops tauschii TaxID=37682 RepID=M8CSN7_AEGTA
MERSDCVLYKPLVFWRWHASHRRRFLALSRQLPSPWLSVQEVPLEPASTVGREAAEEAAAAAPGRRPQSGEKQLKKLQQLLLRARTVVEKADGRYITNSRMLAQLTMLADAMYRGYWALGVSNYISLEETTTMGEEEGEDLKPSPLKRLRTVHSIARKNRAMHLLELQGTLERLEDVVAGMMEFVVLLGGCDRMLRRPYDAYLFSDKIMFGRHTEKQKLLNFMLQHRPSWRIAQHGGLMPGNILVVVELVSYIHEEDWAKFYSTVATSMDNGSKVIIISCLKNSKRLGTVEPIFLNTLPYEEFSYLFKTLAFGSANPAQHPRLARIADELAREFQSEWSIATANLFADIMRRNLNVHFWLCILSGLRRVVERNLSLFGEHPKLLTRRHHQIGVTDLVLHPMDSPLWVVYSCTSGSSRTEVTVERELLPRVWFADLVMDPGVRPQGDFNVVVWESRLPPYTSFVHFATSGNGAPGVAQQSTPLSGRKRAEVPL